MTPSSSSIDCLNGNPPSPTPYTVLATVSTCRVESYTPYNPRVKLAAALTTLLITTLTWASNLNTCAPYIRSHVNTLTSAAAEFNIPPELLTALVKQESYGDPNATLYYRGSGPQLEALYRSQAPRWDAALKMGWTYHDLASSMGLTQMLGSTAWSMGAHYPPSKLLEPSLNLRLGARYLSDMRDRFGSWETALEAFNAGETRVANGDIPLMSVGYAERIINEWGRLLACEGRQ